MAICLVGLGSNVGDRQRALDRGVELLGCNPAIRVKAHSRWYQTAAIGGPAGQDPFLNGAALLETSLEPGQLASVLLAIEAELGRQRSQQWAPRTLDLDLLLYNAQIIETPDLVVPHPRMAWRRFVLQPAAEIAPSMLHPRIAWTIGQLWNHLNTALPYVAVTAATAADKAMLARWLVEECNTRKPGTTRLIADPPRPPRLQGHGPDWASRALQGEIEFLDRRAALLAPGAPEWSLTGVLAIGEFWFDEWLAFASLRLPPEDLPILRRHWTALAAGVVRPKLLVHWQTTTDPLARALGQLASRPGLGPVLELKDRDPEQAVRETLAAIDAMG